MLQKVIGKVEAVLEIASLKPSRFDYCRRTRKAMSNKKETAISASPQAWLQWPTSAYSISSALPSWKTQASFFFFFFKHFLESKTSRWKPKSNFLIFNTLKRMFFSLLPACLLINQHPAMSVREKCSVTDRRDQTLNLHSFIPFWVKCLPGPYELISPRPVGTRRMEP